MSPVAQSLRQIRGGTPARATADEEKREASRLISHIIERCPRRLAATQSERLGHEILADSWALRGTRTQFQDFRFSTNFYALLLLHFGVAVLGSLAWLVSPLLGFGLHLLAGVSYFGESTRRFYLLRHVFPWKRSRNLLATLPAKGLYSAEPRQRVVLIGHIDAAYTGLMFKPEMIRQGTKEPPHPWLGFLRKQMQMVVGSIGLLCLVDLAAWYWGPGMVGVGFLVVLSIPSLIAAVLNLDVVIRDEVVPGANDNLTGCVGGLLLADRLCVDQPDDVELVFVATGAEEAGTGGAMALAREMEGLWTRDRTVILAIDGLSNGELRVMEDGEIIPLPIAPWLLRLAEQTRQEDPRFSQVQTFQIPTGASDSLPFQARGYDGLALVCVDPEIGAPRHYHYPTDTAENLDLDQLILSLDYIEALVRRIWVTDPSPDTRPGNASSR